jgi:hypothetical protein
LRTAEAIAARAKPLALTVHVDELIGPRVENRPGVGNSSQSVKDERSAQSGGPRVTSTLECQHNCDGNGGSYRDRPSGQEHMSAMDSTRRIGGSALEYLVDRDSLGGAFNRLANVVEDDRHLGDLQSVVSVDFQTCSKSGHTSL